MAKAAPSCSETEVPAGRALRTETVICNTHDFGRRVCAKNWKALRDVGQAANRRLCDAEAQDAMPAPDVGTFERVTQPSTSEEGLYAPALRFGVPSRRNPSHAGANERGWLPGRHPPDGVAWARFEAQASWRGASERTLHPLARSTVARPSCARVATWSPPLTASPTGKSEVAHTTVLRLLADVVRRNPSTRRQLERGWLPGRHP